MTHYLLRSHLHPGDALRDGNPALYACAVWNGGFVQHIGHPDLNGQKVLLLTWDQMCAVMQHPINHRRRVVAVRSLAHLPSDLKPEHLQNPEVLTPVPLVEPIVFPGGIVQQPLLPAA